LAKFKETQKLRPDRELEKGGEGKREGEKIKKKKKKKERKKRRKG
jgi:hypothetical protein